MASTLNKFVGSLAAQPQVPSSQYEGLEYKWKFLTFRPAVLKPDLIFIGLAVIYALAYVVGKSSNSQRAQAWYKAHKGLLSSQFSRPSQGDLTADGNSDFFVFSTGRRAVRSLHTVFRLLPRHDAAQRLWQFGWTNVDLKYQPADLLTLEFELDEKASATIPGLVWAVVAKGELSTIRDERWDLTFTKATENSALPPSISVLSEHADITENVLKPLGTFSLPKLLSEPANLRYFRSLSVTDQPFVRPNSPIKPEQYKKYVVLSLDCPPTWDAAATVPLVTGVFQLIDALAGSNGKTLLNLRPESKTKLKKRREELAVELKAESERDTREAEKEAKEAKEAAKRKAEQDRIASLPAAEQQKILERERKRNLRKGQSSGRVGRK